MNPNLQERLLSLLRSPGYRPLRDHELIKAIDPRMADRNAFRHLLKDLEGERRIQRIRGNRYVLAQAPPQGLTGKLSVLPQGFGFVMTEDKDGRAVEFFIPPGEMGHALHGDRVEISPAGRASAGPSNRREGRIVRVVERTVSRIVGRLEKARSGWYVVPDNPRFQSTVLVRGFADGVKPQDSNRVLVEIERSESLRAPLAGTVVEDLGSFDDPAGLRRGQLKERGYEAEFEDHVLDAAKLAPAHIEVTPELARERLDLRNVPTVTIDPVDARDFDDAISIERLPGGGFRAGIHIADVSHFVTPGSEVDIEARRRGNSVYLVGSFIPMLPTYLTKDVCSLKPNVDRLAYSVIVELDDKYRITKTTTGKSIIHSRCRFNYDEVQSFIEGNEAAVPRELHEVIRDTFEISRAWRKKRLQHGALDLAMPEVKCILDEEGRVIDIQRRGASEAYNLIEEFMLVANVAVAEFISRSRVPGIYRIHEPPTDEQWESMAETLANLGFTAAPKNRTDMNRFLESTKGSPLQPVAHLGVLRNLKRAMYSPKLIEHFGLAFPKYTHFTSPIRRYADLVVHRILFALEKNQRPPYSHDDMTRIGAHVSDTERSADEAESESMVSARIEFYSALLAKGETGPWDAWISEIAPRGLLVEVLHTLQRGLVPGRDMPMRRGRDTGRHGGGYRVGQIIQVELVRVDTVRRLVDFRIAGGSGTTTPRPSPKHVVKARPKGPRKRPRR